MKTSFVLWILILLCIQHTAGQTAPVGQYKIEVSGYGNHSKNASCDNHMYIDIRYNDNTSTRIVQIYGFPENQNFNISGSHTFSASKKVSSFYFYSQRSWSNWFGCVGPTKGWHTKSISFPYNCTLYNSSEKGYNTAAGGLWYDNINVTIRPLLMITDTDPANNFIATDHQTPIVSHTGFAYGEYRWEYRTSTTGSFQSLPQYDGMSAISVTATDILGTQADSYVGQFIDIRQVSGCGNYSNIVTYRILKSAPKVIGPGTAIPTTCYDTDDGQYRLYFDRPLDSAAGEYISIGLTDPVTLQPVNADFTNITALEADNSYNLTGLPAATYQLKIIGKYNGVDNYSETTTAPLTIVIGKYTPVDFTVGKTDVWCYQGTDGQIRITATGGTMQGYQYRTDGGQWTAFPDPTAFTHTIDGLSEGSYTLQVRDSNGCIARIQATDPSGSVVLGAEKELTVILDAPQQPLSVSYTLIQEPLYHGATNGKLVAKIDGGTIADDYTYWYEWTDAEQQPLPATGIYTSGSYYITLDTIPAGAYYLTIRDKNYAAATDKSDCTIVASHVQLTQPDPLSAQIILIKPVSCHADNEFGDMTDSNPYDGQRDESQDGALQVVAQGGKPYTGTQNSGRPYIYTWKVQATDGTWQIMPEPSDTLQLLADGHYAVNIEDANGIVIGVYAHNALVEATDLTYYLLQPDRLQLDFDTMPATCAGADGTAAALVTGGTPPYTYHWSTGESTGAIAQLSAMPYFVTVTDARGCIVQGTTVVAEPAGIDIRAVITPLRCHNATDAAIELSVTGGTAPYSYLWDTGGTDNSAMQLGYGTYTVIITDAQGCSYSRTYDIVNPALLRIDLGEDRTLCNGQSLQLDAATGMEAGTVYSWTSDNGYTVQQPQAEITDPGTYTVTATTPDGCIITDSIHITRTDVDIDAEFLLTTQAFADEEVILVNVSNPRGTRTEWLTGSDPSISVIDKSDGYITLRFAQPGSYAIDLIQTQGDCYQMYRKEIIVEQNNGQYNSATANAGFIRQFTVAPNPSDGNFEVIILLEDSSPVTLRLFTLAGQHAAPQRSLTTDKVHTIRYDGPLSAGTYILVLETPYQVLTRKIIIY